MKKKEESVIQLKNLVNRNQLEDKYSRDIWNANQPTNAQSSRENIKVFVRVRPTTEKEEDFEETVSVIGKRTLILKRGPASRFQMNFDRVFPKEATQEDVYSVIREYVVVPCLSGFNSTIFAYGQTGAGKTFTILGDERSIANMSLHKLGKSMDSEKANFLLNRGLIPRIVEHILRHIDQNKDKIKYNLYCSYLEIYSEKIYDLLLRANDREMALDIRQDKHSGVYVKDLTTVQVSKAADIYELLECGAKNRSIRCTESNERSSRSHTIFQLIIEQEILQSEGIRKISKLNVVDLAGSERWTSIGSGFSDPERIAEMTSINSSLATLGNCINALSQKGRNHIPYRDSKLTRLLQDSLGGNNKTVFISNISPSLIHYDETFSTLRFAERANRIHMNATINEVVDDKVLIQRYEKEIDRLRSELRKKNEKANEEILEENRKLMEDNQKLVTYLKEMGHLEKIHTQNHDQTEKVSKFTAVMLERIEKDQQVREEALARYHNWIHSIPIIEEDGEYAIEMKEKLALMQRTIQIKQEEIERIKKLSQRDFSILQNEIIEKNEEIEFLTKQNTLLEQQVTSYQIKTSLSSGKSSIEVAQQMNDESEGKELLELLSKYEEKKDKLYTNQKLGLEAFSKRLTIVLEEHIFDDILPRLRSKQQVSEEEIRDELRGIVEGCCEALTSGVISRQSDFMSQTHILLKKMHDVTVSMMIRSRNERYDLLKKLKQLSKQLKKSSMNSIEIQTEFINSNENKYQNEQNNQNYQKELLSDLDWLNQIQSSTFTTLSTLKSYAFKLHQYYNQAFSLEPKNEELQANLEAIQDIINQLSIDFNYIESQFTETAISLNRLKRRFMNVASEITDKSTPTINSKVALLHLNQDTSFKNLSLKFNKEPQLPSLMDYSNQNTPQTPTDSYTNESQNYIQNQYMEDTKSTWYSISNNKSTKSDSIQIQAQDTNEIHQNITQINSQNLIQNNFQNTIPSQNKELQNVTHNFSQHIYISHDNQHPLNLFEAYNDEQPDNNNSADQVNSSSNETLQAFIEKRKEVMRDMKAQKEQFGSKNILNISSGNLNTIRSETMESPEKLSPAKRKEILNSYNTKFATPEESVHNLHYELLDTLQQDLKYLNQNHQDPIQSSSQNSHSTDVNNQHSTSITTRNISANTINNANIINSTNSTSETSEKNLSISSSIYKSELLSETESLKRRLEQLDASLRRFGSSSSLLTTASSSTSAIATDPTF